MAKRGLALGVSMVMLVSCYGADEREPDAFVGIAGPEDERSERAGEYLKATASELDHLFGVTNEVIAQLPAALGGETVASCAAGGSVALTWDGQSAGFQFSGCRGRFGGAALSGGVTLRVDVPPSLEQPAIFSGTLDFGDVEVLRADGPVALVGTLDMETTSVAGALDVSLSIADSGLELAGDENVSTLSGFSLHHRSVALGRHVELSFSGAVASSRLGQTWSATVGSELVTEEQVLGSLAQLGSARLNSGTLDLRVAEEVGLRGTWAAGSVSARWDLDGDGNYEDGPYALTTAVDFGNALSFLDGASGPVVVDPNAPFRIVSRTPEDGATGVDPAAPIVVEFSHDLALDNYGTVRVSVGFDSYQYVPVEVLIEGNTLNAQPLASFEHGTTYGVELDWYLEDDQGNRLPDDEVTEWSFTTAPYEQIIELDGKVEHLVYDPGSHVAYTLDATNRELGKLDLTSRGLTKVDVLYVPIAACVDAARQRLFVVNKGSSYLSEYDTSDLSLVRNISWPAPTYDAESHFHIHCGPDGLYVVDGMWAPGLWTVESLDTEEPVVTDHTELVSGVGDLALNAAGDTLYHWYQYGWGAGLGNSAVYRISTADFARVDETLGESAQLSRDPLDTPIFLDESRGLVLTKNRIYESDNLATVVYTLPGEQDAFDGPPENIYAFDGARGRFATRQRVYSIEGYSEVASTPTATAEQLFFDKDGVLYLLDAELSALYYQALD